MASSEPRGWCPWNLVCCIRYSSTTKFVQMMTLGWPWPFLWHCQFCFLLMLLYEWKLLQHIVMYFQACHFPGPWEDVPLAEYSNIFRWTQPMLMHEKTCMIPIFKQKYFSVDLTCLVNWARSMFWDLNFFCSCQASLKIDLYDLVIFDHFRPTDWRGNRDEFWSNFGNSR